MNNAATLANVNNASDASAVEVVVIGSGGIWAKGPTLDAAFDNAKKFGGSLGKQVVVTVAPVSIETWVDEVGALRWNVVGGDHSVRPRYVYRPEGTSTTTWWPNRRTAALRAAVEAALAG